MESAFYWEKIIIIIVVSFEEYKLVLRMLADFTRRLKCKMNIIKKMQFPVV